VRRSSVLLRELHLRISRTAVRSAPHILDPSPMLMLRVAGFGLLDGFPDDAARIRLLSCTLRLVTWEALRRALRSMGADQCLAQRAVEHHLLCTIRSSLDEQSLAYASARMLVEGLDYATVDGADGTSRAQG